MSYYILPKINNQVLICPSKIAEDLLQPYVSHSLLRYISLIKEQIDNIALNLSDLSYNNYNELIKLVNPYEYIFSKIPGSKYSVSKLKPTSNLFYDFLEVCNILNVFETYETSHINSLHITKNISDTIECFEMLRENFDDKITYYNGFNNDTIKEIDNLQEKFDFLVFEEDFNNLNIKNYFTFIANCALTIFKCQIQNGSCIIKIDNTCYKLVIDFIYILSSLYDKVYVLKPNSNNTTTFEKYIVCKNYQCNSELCNENYVNLLSLINSMNNDNTIINSFLNFETPYYFLSKIDDINVIIGHQQIESLDLITNILKNKNREERIETFRKTNIIKSVAWCEKYKIPCNRFSEKVNMFLPLLNKAKDENNTNENACPENYFDIASEENVVIKNNNESKNCV